MDFEKLLSNIEKYHLAKPNVYHEDDGIVGECVNYSFIASERRKWIYDMMRQVVYNMNGGYTWKEPFSINYRQGLRNVSCYQDENGVLYTVSTKPYLNNNQLFVIQIENPVKK